MTIGSTTHRNCKEPAGQPALSSPGKAEPGGCPPWTGKVEQAGFPATSNTGP